jgi:hypothetical protein
MDLKGLEYEGVDWIHMTQNRHQRRALMNTVVHLQIHKWGGGDLSS